MKESEMKEISKYNTLRFPETKGMGFYVIRVIIVPNAMNKTHIQTPSNESH